MKIALMVLVAVAGAIAAPSFNEGCSRWCRTPSDEVYCCHEGAIDEYDNQPFKRQGRCPRPRPSCVNAFNFGSPQVCSDDSECGFKQKCCYDTCLEHHTCKPVVSGSDWGTDY